MKITKIKPMFTSIVTTMNCYDGDGVVNGVIVKGDGELKEWQEVVAIGSSVRDIKVGDKVMINPRNYAVKKHQEGSLKDGVITDNPVIKYNFNVLQLALDGGEEKNYLLLQDRDVDYVFEGEEDVIETHGLLI